MLRKLVFALVLTLQATALVSVLHAEDPMPQCFPCLAVR